MYKITYQNSKKFSLLSKDKNLIHNKMAQIKIKIIYKRGIKIVYVSHIKDQLRYYKVKMGLT